MHTHSQLTHAQQPTAPHLTTTKTKQTPNTNQSYTWDKQLETWVKSAGILGGGAGREPTIISPKQYCRRFRAAIGSYFTVVPGAGDAEPPLDPDAP